MTAGPRTAAWLAAATHGRADAAGPPVTPTNQTIAAQNTLFAARVLSWHRVVPLVDGNPSAMCSCGVYAVMCAYLRAAHDILGHPVPWDTANPPDPYREA